jgi:hypothetical protein
MLVLLVLSRVVFGRSLAPGEGRNEQLCTGFQPCAHCAAQLRHTTTSIPPRDRLEPPLRPQYLANASIRSSARLLLNSTPWRITA